MRRIIARLLVIIGLTILAAGRRLERPAPPAAKMVVTLPRRAYRPASPRPGWFTQFVPVFCFG